MVTFSPMFLKLEAFSGISDLGVTLIVKFDIIGYLFGPFALFRKMPWSTPEQAMPWVGLYVALASLVCVIAMAIDALHGFWRWKLWFPNKYFTLNAVSLSLIAIAMKLPVDLSSNNSDSLKVDIAKIISIIFLFTMLANILPSLGLMSDKELLVNMVALCILIITINVNLLIQVVALIGYADPVIIFMLIFPLLLVLSVALTVPASRRNLEHQYKELHALTSNSQDINFSFEEFTCKVKKFWMMAETGNPQFALACSQVSSVFGVVCSILVLYSIPTMIGIVANLSYFKLEKSEYKWSIKLIIIVQLGGIIVGGIAPSFRCFTSIGYFKISKTWSKNHLNVFRVEKIWIQMLQLWKRNHVVSHIPGRHAKIVVQIFKNSILNICIVLQVIVVVMCKIICLVPRSLLILFSFCCYICKSLLKRLTFKPSVSEINAKEEMDEYTRYVLQIQDDAKLSKRILRNTLKSITRLLQVSEKKCPRNLIKLLRNSKGFNGVIEFDDERVPPLISEVIHNSWSLVVVTLTAIAIALPSISNEHIKQLLLSVNEGLYFVRHVEECLNNEGESLVHSRKASRRVGIEVEVYRKWLQIDLQKMASSKGKTSKDILQWLGDEAVEIVKKFNNYKNASLNHSLHKFIAANTMYKISQAIQFHHNHDKYWPTDKEVFFHVTTLIADIFLACFTNLPRVITLKCHHDALEKRQDSIRTAAEILGKSKKILKILKVRQLPNLDTDSMAYLDKWNALSKMDISNSSTFAYSSELLMVTIM